MSSRLQSTDLYVWVSGEFLKMSFNRVLDDGKDYLSVKIEE